MSGLREEGLSLNLPLLLSFGNSVNSEKQSCTRGSGESKGELVAYQASLGRFSKGRETFPFRTKLIMPSFRRE